jgi:hypothetical protein
MEEQERETGSNLESLEVKTARLLWTSHETQIVGKFLSGEQIDIIFGEGRNKLWEEVKGSSAIESEETQQFLDMVRQGVGQSSEPTLNVEKAKETTEKVADTEEYNFTVKESARVIQQIAADAISKFGIWDSEDSRRMKAYAGLRSKDKSNYSQTETMGENVQEKGYIPPTEGGISLIEEIYSPRLENSKNTSGNRTLRSLGHEIQHVLRQLTNKNYWKGHEAEAEEAGLRKPDTANRKKYIGGYYVGSNMQGSEAVGELFAMSVGYKLDTGEEPNIEDLVPILRTRVTKELQSAEKKLKDSKVPRLRYLAANFALLTHLENLTASGYGDNKATDLMALGSFGYVSFEKAPELIQLGVIDQNKFKKMKQVVSNVYDWLTSNEEAGFKIS